MVLEEKRTQCDRGKRVKLDIHPSVGSSSSSGMTDADEITYLGSGVVLFFSN